MNFIIFGRNFQLHKNKLIKGIIVLFMIFMLLYPGASFRGASTGLLLWFYNVLPTLLPFIILSNLMVRLHITRQISRVFHPILGRVFHVSLEGCYPILLGFLSGIPMGAKATADLISENKISMGEGQFLLSMCNNASPMFILGYIALTQLKLPHIKYSLFAIIYASAIISALIFRYIYGRLSKAGSSWSLYGGFVSETKDKSSNRFTFELLDSAIMNGFEVVTRIGGYIILFSILAQILKETGPDTGVVKSFLMGILEITTGVSQVCGMNIDINIKIVLVAVLTSFGGLSGIAQTNSVLQGSRLSIWPYLIVKFINIIVTTLLCLFYVSFFLQ